MDVDTVLQSVQERDKWRSRLTLLQESLREVRTREDRLQTRLRRIKRELAQLAKVSDAILDESRRQFSGGAGRARSAADPQLAPR
jgi:chromosome segregation ATPase